MELTIYGVKENGMRLHGAHHIWSQGKWDLISSMDTYMHRSSMINKKTYVCINLWWNQTKHKYIYLKRNKVLFIRNEYIYSIYTGTLNVVRVETSMIFRWNQQNRYMYMYEPSARITNLIGPKQKIMKIYEWILYEINQPETKAPNRSP